ncbi:hydrolase [Chelatococcus composti]|jgi:nicotinamidase-related amidase|uniref:Nicotinamidase-related amidase n=1 Tax=Chelatococcus composti TaxID=1743235 RepID=A0A841KCE2_9HYPH|nr:hydrolase [Chelatococcus composti]MBB6166939.1 nicotinamidase-related amidase [Chelatococcus composti]MBS7737160.1 hydrolase [Chelatococcus composti]GGG24639.1 hydrolase [Chelatococcus composti]
MTANLLTPDNHALLLIDHQYLQLLTLRSHEASQVINNAQAVAKASKIFGIPTLLTTAIAERQDLIKEIQDVFPEQVPLDRTTLNTWEDTRVVDWVRQTGKKKLVMAGLWTEVCLLLPVLSALADGYEVYFITDASGGASREAHDMAVARMIQAGAVPTTTWSYVSELQRDWAREETAGEVTKLFEEHGGGFGQGLRWEWQLLGLKEGTR